MNETEKAFKEAIKFHIYMTWNDIKDLKNKRFTDKIRSTANIIDNIVYIKNMTIQMHKKKFG